MPRPQLSIRTLLYLTLVVATILTGWAMVDEVDAATELGNVAFGKIAWMAVAYLGAFVVLLRFRP